jgi:acyl-coenzyme A thioesterase PaaI-like protein
MNSPSTLLLQWQKLAPKFGGTWLFSRILGRMAPYSGSIKPRVVELSPGRAVVLMHDRQAVRNHLRSVHAIALMNLGEISTGLAVLACLGSDRRGIVTKLSMEYSKKARGTMQATCEFHPPAPDFEGPFTVRANLVDEEGDVVSVATAEWTIGFKPK